MASAAAIARPNILLKGFKAPFKNQRDLPLPSITGSGKQRCVRIVAKAAGDNSDSSSGSIVNFVENVWANPEDRIALAGLGFAGIVATWASINLITAIDKIPFIPSTLEFIGILFSWWFIYRYLLFKPDREELVKIIKSSISEVIGQ